MAKTILITGGAASGKSRWAASYFAACDNVLYICTADAVDTDTMKRIEYGCKQNFVEWDIRTGVKASPADLIDNHKFVIFDNLGAYASEIIGSVCPEPEKMTDEIRREIEKQIIGSITELYEKVSDADGSMIAITLETGFSVVPENRSQAVFREILGNVNQRIANMSSEVYLSASGIQFKIKD